VAAGLGYLIGHKCGPLLNVLFVLGLVLFYGLSMSGTLPDLGGNKKAAEEMKNAAFDAKSLDKTLLWLEAEGVKVTEIDKKKNEVLSQEAFKELTDKLAKVVGSEVQWQAKVKSVNSKTVVLEDRSLGSGLALKFEVIAAGAALKATQDDPFALPITVEQSRKLGAGDVVQFFGRIFACRAERTGDSLTFTLTVSEAKLVE
jgi:hypothetical protein